MKKATKINIRMTCLSQAVTLKHLSTDEFKDKSVVELAKELESYILKSK